MSLNDKIKELLEQKVKKAEASWKSFSNNYGKYISSRLDTIFRGFDIAFGRLQKETKRAKESIKKIIKP